VPVTLDAHRGASRRALIGGLALTLVPHTASTLGELGRRFAKSP
jgi:hypothetical protein